MEQDNGRASHTDTMAGIADCPITLTAVAWRIGVSVLDRRLADGIVERIPATILPMSPCRPSWRSPRTPTAVGSASSSSLSICPRPSTWSLNGRRWLRQRRTAPPDNVLAAAGGFYSQHRRIFCAYGIASKEWVELRGGLPQGCPTSPGFLGVIMARWVEAMQHAGVSANALADDRTIRTTTEPSTRSRRATRKMPTDDVCDAIERLEKAKKCSDDFDEAYQLKTNRLKCKVSASCSRLAGLAAARLDYQSDEEHVSILGVRLHIGLAEGKADYLRYDRGKVFERLRRISYAVAAPGGRWRLIASLVIPMLTWAAGLVGYGDDVDKVQGALDKARLARKPASAARRLIAELDDMGCDVKTVTRWRAMTALLRIEALRDYNPEWLGRLPAVHWDATILDISPGALDLMNELGWR